jgi:hypothetical protein
MRADNTAAIITAAQRRHELTRAKAIRALRELDHAGAPVTFEAAARAAGVSPSWLYAQPGVRAEIERLRHRTRRAPSPAIPAGNARLTPPCTPACRPHWNTTASSPRTTSGCAASSRKHPATSGPQPAPVRPPPHARPPQRVALR